MKVSSIMVSSCFLFLSSYLYAQNNLGKEYISKTEKIPYLVYTPDDYKKNEDINYPTILFLHGGDRSNTKHHPRKYADLAGIDFPFIVIAPHCTGNCSWNNVDFSNLLKEATKNYRIDKNRLYITGYSMGAYGVWSAITNYSKLFAAAAPIAGGGNKNTICKAKNVVIRAYHGDKDRVIPYNESIKLTNTLKKCYAKVTLITIKNGNHGIWPNIYQDSKFYNWLLKQKKSD